VAVSQELLFLLFMVFELGAILSLYQFVIIPRIALKTNNLFEERMLDKTWDIPAMLEDYTEHLMGEFSIFLRQFFASAAGNAAKSIGKTEEGGQLNLVQSMMSNLQNEEWYIQALAPRLLGLLQNAGAPGETVAEAIKTAYNPGLARR
jgi:hypothetical protein